jgi:hypothetical protein
LRSGSTAASSTLSAFLQGPGFFASIARRDLLGGVFQIAEDFVRGRFVVLVEFQQFVEHVVAIDSAGVLEELSSIDHLEDRPRGPIGDAATDVTGVDAGRLPEKVLAAVMGVAFGQVIGDAEPGGSE